MPEPIRLHGTTVGTTVACAVLRAFQCLPKTGKPQGHEHTVLAGNSCTFIAQHIGSTCDSYGMLAGFVASRAVEGSMECHVVALGTKCLSAPKRTCQVTRVFATRARDFLALLSLHCRHALLRMQKQRRNATVVCDLQGDLINDSHAEVIAKRAVQVWLYGELDAALSQVPCIVQ